MQLVLTPLVPSPVSATRATVEMELLALPKTIACTQEHMALVDLTLLVLLCFLAFLAAAILVSTVMPVPLLVVLILMSVQLAITPAVLQQFAPTPLEVTPVNANLVM